MFEKRNFVLKKDKYMSLVEPVYQSIVNTVMASINFCQSNKETCVLSV